MDLIGAWPLLMTTMGIVTTDFVALLMNSEKWNADVLTRGRKDLVDYYTQEEIEVKFILDCLFTENRNRMSRYVHDIMVTSVLKFISKISG